MRVRWLGAALALLVGRGAVAPAQASTSDGAGTVLQLRPRVGDTLRIRLEQQTEVSGTRTPGVGPTTSATVHSLMRIFSRMAVEEDLPDATLVRTVTDSVVLTSTDPHARGLGEQLQRSLVGATVRLRVAPDGTMGLADPDAPGRRSLSQTLALMPAALPRAPIAVGESWVREMPLPAGTVGAGRSGAGGWLRARFRLDSLGHGGAVAYISMHGEMRPDTAERAAGVLRLEKGTVTGTMQLDRHRGWLTESRFTIVAHTAAGSDRDAGPARMRFTTRITQYMTLEKR